MKKNVTNDQLKYIKDVMYVLEKKGKSKSRMYQIIRETIHFENYDDKESEWFNSSVKDYYLKNK